MNQVYRCYTEKREGFQVEAGSLLRDLRDQLGITGLTRLRILCRYDSQGLSPEIYAKARQTVFSEPMVDDCYDETMPELGDCTVFAVESLPGSVRSAGRFLRPVHRNPDLRRASSGIRRQGLCPLWRHHPRGASAHQGICHQPRGEPAKPALNKPQTSGARTYASAPPRLPRAHRLYYA